MSINTLVALESDKFSFTRETIVVQHQQYGTESVLSVLSLAAIVCINFLQSSPNVVISNMALHGRGS